MRIGEYLRELVNCRIKGYLVRQEDIVILTPYRKQVNKFYILKLALRVSRVIKYLIIFILSFR